MARMARIVSISFPGIRGDMTPVERSRAAVDDACRRIDEAAFGDPDLIVLPETFTGLGAGGDTFFTSAEPIPGPTTDALAEKARKYATYIVFGILRRCDGKLYNASVLLGRDGSVRGIYHK
ncbi:MAG TPA: carbon-nitrogen hydrolase family protein, partial [Firmicutes bacterium]|nr:carbon-nitrogen hydrolase family protein [Bacillota bacterium]